MSGDRERYLAMGMNGYVSKPLAERDLLSEIQHVFADEKNGVPAFNSANCKPGASSLTRPGKSRRRRNDHDGGDEYDRLDR
jgi:DNA-binding NarL/FixJ family response regulator